MNYGEPHNARYSAETSKACEVIIWLANRKPKIDVYHVVKCAFLADKYHLNEYGRPITGDTYNAAPYGPLGQVVYGLLSGEPFALLALGGNGQPPFSVNRSFPFDVTAVREANLDKLSGSDVEALEYAVREFADLSFDEIYLLTHNDPAYANADGFSMRYEDFLSSSKDRDEKIQYIRETAPHVVF